MSDWKTCINNKKCFSYVLYNSDGTVDGKCKAYVKLPSGEYNSVTMGTDVMTLNCGGKRISIVGRNPSEFQIGTDTKVFALRDDGKTSILDLEIDTAYETTAVPTASTERVLAKVELKEGDKSIVKGFDSKDEYDAWKGGLGEGQVKSEKIYFLNTSGTDARFRFGFETEDELKRLLSAPEAFIISPKSDKPEYIYSSKEFAKYLKGRPLQSDIIEAIFLKNTGGTPVLIKGKVSDVGIFAEQLAYDVTMNISEVEGAIIPPDGDFGVKFTGGYGLRNDENYLKDNLDDTPWVDESVKNDFAAAQTDERAKYWQIGLEIEGHYIWNIADWFQLAFGASDDIDYTKGPTETANSWLVSNTIATDIGLRIGYPGIFFIGLYPANIGWYYAGGETTLKDTSVKQETDINALVWQPEAEIGFFLSKKRKCALSLEYYYRHFIESSIPLQGAHAGGLSFKLLFGGSQEMDRKVEAERHERPQPASIDREIETTINVEPERPLEYTAVHFQKAIDVKFDNANAFFEKNSSDLSGDGIAAASGLALKIKTYFGELRKMGIEVDPGTQNLMIKAFADSQGKAEYPKEPEKRGNAKLSADRAQSFSSELASELKEDSITVESEGMGEQFPDLYKCDGSCDIADIRPETQYRYQDTEKERALFANGKATDINIDRLYKIGTHKGKDSLAVSNYADALYGQVSLDLEGDKKKELYIEDLTASRRLTAKLTYNLDAIDALEARTFVGEPKKVEIGGATFTNILVPLGSTKFIPEKLDIKENSAFVGEFIRPFIYMVKEANDESDVSEVVISISLNSKNSARGTGYIGKYLGFVAGRFTDKPVRVFVSVNDRFGDSIIFAKGSQTANIDPAADDENSLQLRNKWLEMLNSN